jgi:hypothetical protein
MSLTTRVGLLAGASALTLTGASVADNSTAASSQEARIAELEAQVAQLTGEHWLTEQRSEEIRGLVEDVLADADTRASLLQSGMTAGYDDGFVIGSPDGNFTLRINGHLQARLVWNEQDEGDDLTGMGGTAGNPVDGDTSRRGFEVSRARLIFSGNVAGPEWGYYVNADFGSAADDSGDFELQDAWISYDMGNGWSWRGGQFKNPVVREWLVDSSNQLAIERSNLAYFYGGGRTQGVMFDYEADQWRMSAAMTDGSEYGSFIGGMPAFIGTDGQNSAALDYDTEWAFAARAEILFSGNWDQFDDFTSPQGSEQGIMAGIGLSGQSDEYGTSTVDNEYMIYILSADVSLEFDGWNLFGSFSYGDIDNDASGAAGVDFNPMGIVVQGGFYFTETLEGFARYEFNDWDDFGDSSADVDDMNWFTVGVNNYYNANIKSSLDVGYGIDGVLFSDPRTGQRTDQQAEDGQFVLRAQMQVTF